MTTSLMVILGLILFLVVNVLFVAFIYNQVVTIKNQVKNAYSQIEVQLKRRHDLIPNLVETVKGYAQHESQTLTNVIQARANAVNVSSNAKIQAKNENVLSDALRSLMAVCENYPDLKANQNYLALQEELVSTENKIGFARQFYNDCVMDYMNKKEIFPNNLIVAMFNFENFEMFEIENKIEKEAVKVQF